MLAYAGKGRVIQERLDLSQVVDRTVRALHGKFPDNVHVRLDLARDLPLLLADPTQMHQVASNLVLNAVEAVGDAPGQVIVRTSRRHVSRNELAGAENTGPLPEGEYVAVEVGDTGVGMADDVRGRMFDPFFSTKFLGRGLGLAALSGIVRSYGGGITVNSVPGRGTTVQVLFPVHTAGAVISTPGQTSDAAGHDRVVLVIDADPVVRRSIAAGLELYGYVVMVAADRAEAVEVMASADVLSAVLVDPAGQQGMLALEAVSETLPSVPVIVCSGGGEDLDRALEGRPLAGVLSKPFTPKRLAAKVAEVLAKAPRQ